MPSFSDDPFVYLRKRALLAPRAGNTGGGGADLNDYRQGMPTGGVYTRTGQSTAKSADNVISAFAANVAPRTNRGLLIEPARTNLVFPNVSMSAANWSTGTSTFASGQASPANDTTASRLTWGSGGTSLVFKGVSGLISGLPYTGTEFIRYASGNLYVVFLWYGAGGSARGWINTTTGETASLSVSGGWSAASIATTLEANGYWRLQITVTVSDTSITFESDQAAVIGGYSAASGDVKDFWAPQLEQGAWPTSPIFTSGAAATRGLPAYSESVPASRTKALLTFADASTSLVSGLTPGGSFDVVTAVLAANKGRFGASELITREWQA